MDRPLAYIVAVLLSLNFVGVTVFTNPHGWINTSLGEAGQLGGILLKASTALATILRNILSLKIICWIQGWSFILDTVLSAVSFGFIYFFLPESSTVKAEDAMEQMWRPHWFWSRVLPARDVENNLSVGIESRQYI